MSPIKIGSLLLVILRNFFEFAPKNYENFLGLKIQNDNLRKLLSKMLVQFKAQWAKISQK